MILPVTKRQIEAGQRPPSSMQWIQKLRLRDVLGIIADVGLVASFALMLIGWGTAGIVVGIVLGCASIGILMPSLVRQHNLSAAIESIPAEQPELDRAA
jgi:hypothetical protein